jgi:hypothetical protein
MRRLEIELVCLVEVSGPIVITSYDDQLPSHHTIALRSHDAVRYSATR